MPQRHLHFPLCRHQVAQQLRGACSSTAHSNTVSNTVRAVGMAAAVGVAAAAAAAAAITIAAAAAAAAIAIAIAVEVKAVKVALA